MQPLVLVAAIFGQAADFRDDVRLSLEFDRMRQRSSYPADMALARREGQTFYLWVDFEDVRMYAAAKRREPDGVHCFVRASQLEGRVQPGLVLGVRKKAEVEKVGFVKSLPQLEARWSKR